jgi:hypothetical protein
MKSGRAGWRGFALLTVSAVTAIGIALPGTASAVPVRGHTAWSVLLCKFSDQPAEPQAPQFFRDFLTDVGFGLGGAADYLDNQSGGRITLRGSAVRGWFQMSHTLEEDRLLGRWDRSQRCVDAASAGGYTVPAGHRIVTILNARVDSGAVGGRVVLDPGAWNVGFAAHELLHGYGLGHSYSNDTSYQNASWSAPGEYDDPWDEMSAMHIYAFATARFGTSAVGLNGYHLDRLGWLPRQQVFTFGADGVGSRTLTLTALEAATTSGLKLIRIPFNPADLHNYYTVEFRRQTGWSAGIPGDTVLIHEVRNGIPYLIRDLSSNGKPPAQSLNRDGVQITVGTLSGDSALVTIGSDIVERCLQGYVWREARPSDRVCVTPTVRSETAADNAAAASRWVDGPYGPHTCISGYVWREAFPGDDVCVVPSRRSQAAADNAAAASRRNPARLVYGPNACLSGYVWREADAADYVCVTRTVRSETAADNAAAASRWVDGPYGPHTCISGYVWREAFPGDDVCVVPSRRSQAAADNAAAASRVARPGG